MQNLRTLTDETLLKETDRLVRQEREVLNQVLHHLREIERRRLFSALKFPSLFAYAVERLGYSEDQACRRISAMRLIQEMPELEEKIASGELNLSLIGVAQSAFTAERKRGKKLSIQKKAEIFESISGLSARAAQKVVATHVPLAPVKETVRAIAADSNVATVVVTDATLDKIEKLKGLLAHVDPNLTTGELLGRLCNLALEEWSPAKASKRKLSAKIGICADTEADDGAGAMAVSGTEPKQISEAEISRQVWKRDGSACTCCASTYAVQEDHIIPKSMGGPYTLENIRLLCRSCNQRAAIEKLGLRKMDRYLSPATSRVRPRHEVREGVRLYA